jgi:hypothetical protein
MGRMIHMQKFGEGNVQQPDPEDPQGVPVNPDAEGLQREGAAGQAPGHGVQDSEGLQGENDRADADPAVYDENQG